MWLYAVTGVRYLEGRISVPSLKDWKQETISDPIFIYWQLFFLTNDGAFLSVS
jgi:hypothetical protein